MARSIVDVLEDKKGEDIVLLDIQGLAPFADYFIICSGTSDRMLRSLADSAVETVKKGYKLRGRVEGQPQDGWVLVDFGDVVLHIFSPDRRNYYRIEELWAQGKVLVRLQ